MGTNCHKSTKLKPQVNLIGQTFFLNGPMTQCDWKDQTSVSDRCSQVWMYKETEKGKKSSTPLWM